MSDKNINNLSPVEYRNRERRIRRRAAAQGLRLRKYPTRVQESPLVGPYMLVDADRNTIEAGGSPSGYGLGLDDVEGVLAEGRGYVIEAFRDAERRIRSERIRAGRK